MAFKLAIKETYKVPVKVSLPNDKGTFDTSEFKAEFRNVKSDELTELSKMPQHEVVLSVLAGFSELLDEEGTALDFNEANVAALLAIPQARYALSEAFWGSLYKAKEKN
jgi:hypothetical protein